MFVVVVSFQFFGRWPAESVVLAFLVLAFVWAAVGLFVLVQVTGSGKGLRATLAIERRGSTGARVVLGSHEAVRAVTTASAQE